MLPGFADEIASLPDGTRLRLRDVGPGDAARLQDLLRHMSTDDVRMRFFAPLRELTPTLLHHLSHPDPAREIALAALPPEDGETLLGVARLALGARDSGEFALAVRSDMKGHGIGYLLLGKLIEHSRARGIAEIWGDVLRENAAMLQMAREHGFAVEDHPEEGALVRVRKSLTGGHIPMKSPRRGADALLETLLQAGSRTIFALSGNHIMPIFDAALDHEVKLIHTRHEAAAVHMAEGWARLTGAVGVALVTAGQGHANALGALCTAQASETPLLLLSGHAPLRELGLGSFQEHRQVELASPLTKASWIVPSAAALPHDIARACRIARSGRPGPVHLSLPAEALEGMTEGALPEDAAFAAEAMALPAATARLACAALAEAARPLVIAPPALATPEGAALLAPVRAALGVPVVTMESPRGLNDPALGAFAEVLGEADLILLLGKPLDFTLRFGRPPAVAAQCRWIVIDPDPALLARAARGLGERLVLSAIADAAGAARALTAAATPGAASGDWTATVEAAVTYRPAEWAGPDKADAPLHPAALCRAVQPYLDRGPEAVLVCDGGEFGQWAQAALHPRCRLINGVAGAIGPSIPFAIGAKAARPGAAVVAMLGDGTFGYHMAELETAARNGLPVVAIVGNDSRWNAEYQIQQRAYGAARARGCTLSPDVRYDGVATALGGHGEYVRCAAELPAALERAFASGKPACVNVLIDGRAAPVVRRGTLPQPASSKA